MIYTNDEVCAMRHGAGSRYRPDPDSNVSPRFGLFKSLFFSFFVFVVLFLFCFFVVSFVCLLGWLVGW